MTAHTQRHSTWLAAQEARITVNDLWLHYFSIGGSLRVFELDAYLHGLYPLPVSEQNAVALALNELIDELPQRRRAEFVEEPLMDLSLPASTVPRDSGLSRGSAQSAG